jgi:hypothetical protein
MGPACLSAATILSLCLTVASSCFTAPTCKMATHPTVLETTARLQLCILCSMVVIPWLIHRTPRSTPQRDCWYDEWCGQFAVSGADNRTIGTFQRRERTGMPTGMCSQHKLDSKLQVSCSGCVLHLPGDGNHSTGWPGQQQHERRPSE